MKPLPLKWIPLQVPLKKTYDFSNRYMIVYIFSGCFSYFTFYMLWDDYLKALSLIGKVPRGLTVKNFGKCLKTLLNGCFLNKCSKEFACGFSLKNCLWWRAVVLCISHASGKAIPRVVKCYQEIFCTSCFSNTSIRLLLKLRRNNQSFLIQSKFSEHHCIYEIFSNFSCSYIITAFSPHFLSLLQSSFFQGWSENDIWYLLKE